MTLLRARADSTYVLSVAPNGLKNGGWVQMWDQGEVPEELSRWELREGGVLRAKAKPCFALCVTQNGLQNGGWVHMWEVGERAVDIFGQWIVHEGELRAKADPRYSLCVRRDGCGNGGHLHMWSFGGPPDIYGQWDILEASPGCGALSVTPVGSGSLQAEGDGEGLLAAAVRLLEEAAVLDENGRVEDLRRRPLAGGLEALGEAANALGGGLGSYVLLPAERLRRASPKGEESCRALLLAELPAQAAAECRDFAEDSACGANAWAGRGLELLSQFLFFLRDGLDCGTGIDMAYKKSLAEHHDFFQRLAFGTAAMQLPQRERALKLLEGGSPGADVCREIAGLSAAGRRVAAFCRQLDRELRAALQELRGRLEMDRAYGRAPW